MRVDGKRFTTKSKGKAWQGELPPRVRSATLTTMRKSRPQNGICNKIKGMLRVKTKEMMQG